ncbi:DUF6477 family protein [Aestuariibius sp. 2305UL40-4]|uniref:DUF6477 family protein n=1 Tax=Aestuariibius violaceus TaxID=3234132 RepID=UPI00345E8730
MQDILSMVARLKRPALLIRAARHGVDEYSRERHLRRVLKTEATLSPGEALMQILLAEAEIDESRRTAAVGYSAAAHVDLLIAMMAEARLLRGLSA